MNSTVLVQTRPGVTIVGMFAAAAGSLATSGVVGNAGSIMNTGSLSGCNCTLYHKMTRQQLTPVLITLTVTEK